MTTRDTEALNLRPWAESGDRITPESTGLDRDTGWPLSYSQPGGNNPNREVWNQLFRELSGLGHEINTRSGVLPWSSEIDYVHPALVMGSDNKVYITVQNTGPGSTAQNPTTDTSDTYWQVLGVEPDEVPDASDYLPQLPYNGSRSDWNDLDDSLIPAGASLAVIRVDSTLTDNRPFGWNGSCIVYIFRHALTGPTWLQQIAYPLNASNVAIGMSYFRRSRDGAGNWGHWGVVPALGSAVLTDTNMTGHPNVPVSANITGVRREGIGHFSIQLLFDYDGTKGAPAVLCTAREPTALRCVQTGATSPTSIHILVFDQNNAQANPFTLSVALLDPATAPVP